jgi:excisionase family DNA binding protein
MAGLAPQKIVTEEFATVSPSPDDTLLARESSRLLASREIGEGESVRVQFQQGESDTESVTVPASAVRLFLQVLAEMSEGHAVTLMPARAELTAQQVADLLNVSRPHAVQLLDEGKIPSRFVGEYRRVRLDDVLDFKRIDDAARALVLDQLSAEAQELGMGY